MRLQGKRAVVTGGGRGIGVAVGRALAEEGAAVVLAARTTAQVEEVAQELRDAGHEAWGLPCDVTDAAQVEALVAGASERMGGVDILVNNAGVASAAPLKRVTLEEWNRLLAVNATGAFLATQAALPGMIEAGWGRVVTVASIAGLSAAPYISAYASSKHAVIGFTRGVAAEVAAKGVTVNAVCPGYVDTPMTDSSLDGIVEKTGLTREAAVEKLRQQSPQHRLFEPDEVAYLVVCLCDPRARGVNGQAIVLDGGGLMK